MARQLEPTNHYSDFSSAPDLCLSSPPPPGSSICSKAKFNLHFPVWPFLWNNKVILKTWCQPSIFTMVCIFPTYALLYACVHICATPLVQAKRKVVNYFSPIKWIPEIKLRSPAWWPALSMLSHPTSPLCTLSSCFETKPIYRLTQNIEIHLPQPRVEGLHGHIESIVRLKV